MYYLVVFDEVICLSWCNGQRFEGFFTYWTSWLSLGVYILFGVGFGHESFWWECFDTSFYIRGGLPCRFIRVWVGSKIKETLKWISY